MAKLSEIMCKESKDYNELDKDFKSVMKDIKALKQLSTNIRKKQNELINEYAKSKMIDKCYKFPKDGYIKYIHILGYEIVDEKPHIVYERKYQGRVNKIDIIKTATDLLDLMFLDVEEISREEYDSIIITKPKLDE
jgi:hypothetical protein